MPYQSIVDATELPRLVRLGPNLYGAVFSLMKLLPARFMIDRAEDRGALGTGTTIIETSSGTFALGLAMVARLRGYQLKIVGDPAIDRNLRMRLRGLGADVEIVERAGAQGGYQQARLDRVAELCEQIPDHFVPGQYDNKDNPTAYGRVAELVGDALGHVDCLVGPVGSGGSTGGLASFLRLANPGLHLVGVDTHGSVIFGMEDRPRLVRGLGNSLLPANVRHDAYDEVHWVNAAETFRATRDLHERKALFMGATSGAAHLVAQWWAARNPGAKVVVMLPDEGNRYQETVYSEEWLHANGVLADRVPDAPHREDHPRSAGPDWSWMPWGRRTLDEVLAAAPAHGLAGSGAAV
ncbi:cystathionine beta-synthase [Streptomyces mashuensis]|uniref:Cystathionine beta-synthase n=1 Tax=Streptomyces mashuensis TaxID=33904 RepID=A0A919BA16_9ACTN|nr:PLP-dependent cysteine synthase family protein [Streptomyces mashuensis]GHF69391.1 cystathionine beta-synthase [Streptomyces mashuensis]